MAPIQPRPALPGPRDRAATQARLVAAAGNVLARDGFAALGVNRIAVEAGCDKVLIYRYFGGWKGCCAPSAKAPTSGPRSRNWRAAIRPV
ncbi:TetR/AcrR family transcriptional regulator [Oleomonas cavernae]|uniref:TetR/AcrR family transcriptional regulator n=1 Tax=Oleomonas cavernae TaxID=2320859 RepID=A0A418WFG4_9PROT|nr:helix-turn-helix domain-containing protein [Oleomonas cavernae]RJF88756.1 TetR/AcrR family transcriptional regulator [Oleomonas cavernae]